MEDRRQNDSLVLERLARMEEQLKQVTEIKSSIEQLNVRLGALDQVYLTRVESQALNIAREQQLKNLEDKISAIEDEVADVKKQQRNWSGWLVKLVGGAIILALLGTVIVQNGK